MKKFFTLTALCLLSLCAFSQAADVVVIPIKGEISEAQFLFLRRALKEAESQNAKAVILDMDTPGGSIDACKEMTQALEQVDQSHLRTITYVHPNANSAGALIALATSSSTSLHQTQPAPR